MPLLPLSEEERRLQEDLRRRLGLEPEGGPGAFSRVTQPIRTFFGATQGVGGRALGALFPDAREKAAEEVRKSFGVGATDPWYRQLEAEPGLGDVAAQLIPESVREGTVGQALGPVGRMAGNILGDPTTYTPAVLGRAGGAIARTIPNAARAMEGAEAVSKALRAADQARGLSPTLLRNAARFGEQRVRKAIIEHGGAKAAAWKAADVIRRGEPYTLGTAAAVAYGPDVVRGVGAGIEQIGEAETIPEGLAAGVNTTLMAGMAALMGHGLISTGKAVRTLATDIGKNTALTVEETAEIARILRGETEPRPDRMLGPGPDELPIPMGPEDAVPRPPAPVDEVGDAIGRPYPPRPYELPPEGQALVDEARGVHAPAEPTAGFHPGARTVGEYPEPAPRETTAEPPAVDSVVAPDVTEVVAPDEVAGRVVSQPEPTIPEPPPIAEPARAVEPEPPVSPVEEVPVVPEEAAVFGAVEENPALVEAIDRFLNSKSDRKKGRMTPDISDRFQERLFEPEFQQRLAALADGVEEPGQIMPALRKIRDEIQEELDREAEVGITREAGVGRLIEAERAGAGENVDRGEIGPGLGKRPNKARVVQAEGGGKLTKRQAQQQAYESAKAVVEAGGTDLVRAAKDLEGIRFRAMGTERPLTGSNLQRLQDYFKARGEGLSRDEAFARVAAKEGVAKRSIQNTIGAAETEVYKRIMRAVAPEATETRQKVVSPKGGMETLERLKGRRAELEAQAPKRKEGQSTGEFAAEIDRNVELQRIVDELETQGEASARGLARQVPIKGLRKVAEDLKAPARGRAPAIDVAHKAISKLYAAQGATKAETRAAIRRLDDAWKAGQTKRASRAPAPAMEEGAPAPKPASTKPEAPVTASRQIARFKPLKVRGRAEQGVWVGEGGTRINLAGENAKVLSAPDDAAVARADVQALLDDDSVRIIDVEDVGTHPVMRELGRTPPRGWMVTVVGGERAAFIREEARYETMPSRLRQHRGIDWTSTGSMDEASLREEGGGPSPANTRMVMGLLGDDSSIYPQIIGRMKQLRITHDPDDLFELVGRGSFHNVFEFKGAGPNGEKYVMRIGKAPYLELPTPEMRQYVMQPIGGEGLINTLGEEFSYTIHRKGIAPTVALEMDKLDLNGEFRERFDLLPVGATGDLATYMQYESYMQREGQLPPGVSLGEHLQDQLDLYEGAKAAGLGIADYIKEDLGRGLQYVRANQTAYIPLGPNDARTGVLRKGSDGTTYKLVFTDYGTVWPKNAMGEWGEMHPTRRIMLMKDLPDSKLSQAERGRRHVHFGQDEKEGVDIGDGLRVVNHDRGMSKDYVQRSAAMLKAPARALADVTKRLVETINKQLPEGQRPLSARYAGVTTSPWMQGLFLGRNKAGGALDNEVYINLVSTLLHGKTREQGIDHTLYALLHEVAHNGGKGHDAEFMQLNEYIMHLAAAEGHIDEFRKILSEAIPEELYKRIMDDLAPEYLAGRKVHGESWRDSRATGVEGVLAGDLEGRAPPFPDRAVGGQAGAPGGTGHGVRPGIPVPRGAGGSPGQLRPAALAEVGTAARSANGEAVRRSAGGGPASAEGGYAGLVQRIEALHENGLTIESAHKEMDDLLRRVPKGRPVNAALDHAFNLATQIEKVLPDAEIEKWAKVAPDPRGREGVVEGPLNLLNLPDVSDRFKARVKIWWELSKPAWDRSKTESWSSVSRDVQDILGLRTPEEWADLTRRSRRPLKTHDVFILQEAHNEMAGRINQSERRLADAIASKVEGARLEALEHEVSEAHRVYQHVAHTLSGTMTGFARGLAAGRRTVRALDPRLRWEQDMLVGLRERLRTEIKEPGERERVARDLFDKLVKIQKEGGDWEGFYKALRAIHKNPTRKFRDMALEWYKAGLIGIPSRVANVTSNALFRKVRYLEDSLAAALDFTRSKLTGSDREVYLGEASVAMMALKRSFREGMRDWIKDTKSAFLLEPEDMEKIMTQGGIAEDYMHMGGAIPGKVGRFVRFHFRGLNADDGLAKHISRTDTYYREVYRKLRKGKESFFKARPGESITAATERIVDDLIDNFSKAQAGDRFDFRKMELFDPIQKKAEELAKDDTFQKQLGPGMQRVQTLLRGPAWAFQTIFPFVRTPTNIFLETIKRTPLGFFDVARKWEKMGPAEQMQALSRPLAGTMIGAFFLIDALDGDLSGGGPVNPDEREALQAIGWQPYSRKFEIGGKTQWIAYNRLEPVASIIGIAADAAEGLRQGDFDHWQDGVERVLKSVAENLTNKTFLSGLDSMLAAASHPRQFLPRFIRQMQGSVVPNSIGYVPFGHLARALDPVYRSTDPFSADVFWSKVPFASQSLDPQYAPTGDTRLRPGTFLERVALPFARQVEEVGPKADAAREIVRLQAAPRAPAREWISPQGFRVKYTKEERARMAGALQQAMQVVGQRLVRDPNYLKLPDTELDPNYRFGQKTKKDVVEDLIRRYRRRAILQIRPGLQRRARQEYRERAEAR